MKSWHRQTMQTHGSKLFTKIHKRKHTCGHNHEIHDLAREQLRRIKSYLHRWTLWWTKTSDCWSYEALLTWFIDATWDEQTSMPAKQLLIERFNKLHKQTGQGMFARRI